ncbi:MAG: hypothetical protein EU550_03355 [Promethearchaeota archaeon]|nr:MAG: hypothetical protein EU550_03355 [Candidatus Lokiarchaeota archaeon]
MTFQHSYKLKYLKEDNYEGKKDHYIIIECDGCPNNSDYFYRNKNCINCIFNILFEKKDDKHFDYIKFKNNENVIKSKIIKDVYNYFQNIENIKEKNKEINQYRKKSCPYKNFDCKIIDHYLKSFFEKEELYLNPIVMFKNFHKEIASIKNYIKGEKIENHRNNMICIKCLNRTNQILDQIHQDLISLKIFKDYKNFTKYHKEKKSDLLFYESYFLDNIIKKKIKNEATLKLELNETLLKRYVFGENNLFEARIYQIPQEEEKFYEYDYFFESDSERDYYNRIINNTLKKIKLLKLEDIIPLEDLLKNYVINSNKILENQYKINSNIKKRISNFIAIKKVGLEKLFPLLMDDLIEELFLDAPEGYIYINHQDFGRCRTQIGFNDLEIDKFKTFIRLYSGKRLDHTNPSIKFVMKNKYFYCRYSIDISPINVNEFSFDIRKLNKNILTIQDLLKNKTLSPEIAALLYFIILRRANITVIGETDSGKTTLINALDLITPKRFRKIYIENVTESLDQLKFEKHQFKLKVDSLSEKKKGNVIYSKTNQIRKLLHRTPDIIYLGEILTKEEAKALFHCLAAGLRGFQTIHASDIYSLTNRFIYHFNINEACLNDLDILVLMKKKMNRRIVVSLSEIQFKDQVFVKNLFKYEPKLNNWSLKNSLFKTQVVKNIRLYENLDEKKFNYILHLYSKLFRKLRAIKKLSNEELITFFNKVSYYSSFDLKTLEQRWQDWMKNLEV